MQQPVTHPEQEWAEEEREVRRPEQIRRTQALIDILDELEQEDPEAQREPVAFLMRVLDEERLSYRPFFS
jgi:hypothetical protein